MPAGNFHIIISTIAAVPTEDHIAEAVAVAHTINKFFMMNNLSAQNAISIGKGEFYFLNIVFLYVGYDLVFIHKAGIISAAS